MTQQEWRICDPCWMSVGLGRTVDQHGCETRMNFGVSDSKYLRLCDCPCDEEDNYAEQN